MFKKENLPQLQDYDIAELIWYYALFIFFPLKDPGRMNAKVSFDRPFEEITYWSRVMASHFAKNSAALIARINKTLKRNALFYDV